MSRIAATILLVCLAGTGAAQQEQEVYRSTDEQGTPSFSDKPERPDSEQIELRGPSVVPAPKGAQINFDFKQPEPKVKYNKVEITSPENDAVVYIRTTNIAIQAKVSPPVRNDKGHRLQITLDGEVLVEGTSSYTLDDAHRGTHTLTARIVDKEGRTVAESDPVKVHIKKPTILQ
jgi:hypothetical protein